MNYIDSSKLSNKNATNNNKKTSYEFLTHLLGFGLNSRICFKKVRTFAQWAGVSERTIQRWRREYVSKGLLTVTPVIKSQWNGQKANIYTPNVAAIKAYLEWHGSKSKRVTPRCHPIKESLSVNTNYISPLVTTEMVEPPGFEEVNTCENSAKETWPQELDCPLVVDAAIDEAIEEQTAKERAQIESMEALAVEVAAKLDLPPSRAQKRNFAEIAAAMNFTHKQAEKNLAIFKADPYLLKTTRSPVRLLYAKQARASSIDLQRRIREFAFEHRAIIAGHYSENGEWPAMKLGAEIEAAFNGNYSAIFAWAGINVMALMEAA